MTAQNPNTTADLMHFSTLGRHELVARIVDLEKRLSTAEEAERRARASEHTMLGTLTSAQELATKSLNIARATKAIGDDPIMQELAVLGAAIVRARGLHPAGCALRHLVSEVGEVAHAMCIGDVGIGGDVAKREERIREELLDVAVVAMRMALGDTRQ